MSRRWSIWPTSDSMEEGVRVLSWRKAIWEVSVCVVRRPLRCNAPQFPAVLHRDDDARQHFSLDLLLSFVKILDEAS